MMPLVAATGDDPEQQLANRIKNTRKLLTTAALIMSVYLIATSFITTVLIPPEEFAPAARRTAGRSPTWRTSTWARVSAPCMTSAVC